MNFLVQFAIVSILILMLAALASMFLIFTVDIFDDTFDTQLRQWVKLKVSKHFPVESGDSD